MCLMIMSSCFIEETPAPICILESIEFSPTNRLEFTTINGGQLYQMKQYVFAEGKDNLVASYQYQYFQDSIVIRDLRRSSIYLPYMMIKMDGNRPLKVMRYSFVTGVKVIYDFDYSDKEKISFQMTRESVEGDRLLFAYGTYTLDLDGNTSRFQQYFIDTETLDKFYLVNDVFYSYDDFTNPTEGLFVPHFTANRLPDPIFFNSNNQITMMESSAISNFSYTYGDGDHTKTQTFPGGGEVIFNYLNCK